MADNLKRVVYIEDEQEMVDLVRLILSRKGYEVLGANGGRKGLQLVYRPATRSGAPGLDDAGYGWLGCLPADESE